MKKFIFRVVWMFFFLSPFRIFAESSSEPQVIHVFVALCDNEHQGIVPVAKHLGNGEDLKGNLYWGAAFGVKTFFQKDAKWKKVFETSNPSPVILERVVFRHTSGAYLVADAYRGSKITDAIRDFLKAASGNTKEILSIEKTSLDLHHGNGRKMVAYVGHDGLMDFAVAEDFRLNGYPKKTDEKKRDAVILACMSKMFFASALTDAGANPLLWTTGLMAPEAYTLKAAVESWIVGEPASSIREKAAKSYSTYQKIGLGGAKKLLVTGW